MKIKSIDWIDLKLFQDVLCGKIEVGIFRGAINQELCQIIARNFWIHPKLKQRKDNVPSFEVGTHHFGKNLDQYFHEVKKENEYLDYLFQGTDNFVSKYQKFIKNYLSSFGITFRLATHKFEKAGSFVMRSWKNNKDFQLLPHDDFAQLLEPNQMDFEIQQVYHNQIISTNICIENGVGGELMLWDFKPTPEEKIKLSIEHTGYPYPLDELQKYKAYTIPINTGDIYFFNSSFVHAVKINISGHRSVISFFCGFIDKENLIYWT